MPLGPMDSLKLYARGVRRPRPPAQISRQKQTPGSGLGEADIRGRSRVSFPGARRLARWTRLERAIILNGPSVSFVHDQS